MAPRATGATFEAATVEIAVAVSAVVAAERWATSRRTLSIGGAGATKGDIATASTGAYGATDTISAIQSATAVGAFRRPLVPVMVRLRALGADTFQALES